MSKKRLLYINYYGGTLLKNVLESIPRDCFDVTVLELRQQQDTNLFFGKVTIINGAYIKNLDELRNFLLQKVKNYDLIFTFSEILVEYVASFCKENSLPYSCDSVISLSRNKFLQRQKWSHTSTIKFFLIESKEDIEKITIDYGICKPINGMGSIGVRRMTLSELRRDYDILVKDIEEDIKFERFGLIEKKFIFEEVIEGDNSVWYKKEEDIKNLSPICAVDGFMAEDIFNPFFIHPSLPFFINDVEYGSVSPPASISEDSKKKIFTFIQNKVCDLGHKNTLLHVEVVLLPNGCLEMLEVATRPAGRAHQEILKRTTNHNPVLIYINKILSTDYCKESTNLNAKSKYAASIVVMPVYEDGTLFPDTMCNFIDINKGIDLVVPNISSTLELINARTLKRVKRGSIKRISSATVYALFLLVNNSYENLIQDANYIRKNQHLFFQ